MRKKTITYIIKFYFWTILFFIELVFYSFEKKKQEPVLTVVSAEINLLDGDEEKLAQKPSQAEAMANKAVLGFSAIPKGKKKQVVIAGIALVYFILFGIVNTVYWMTLIIKKHHVVGWVLLYATFAWIIYIALKQVYLYFKNKKYTQVLFLIQAKWFDAKIKAHKKLNLQII